MSMEVSLDECNAMNDEDVTYKDVVVVGNGPSGIILSYILSGNWPYYSGEDHPDEMLNMRLKNVCSQISLIEQDLQFLSQGMEGRSRNPVAVLIDSLNHPFDNNVANGKSTLLYWRHHPGKVIDHVVIGKGRPGGCWQELNEKITTVSVSSWMQLPGLTFNEWENKWLNLKCTCADKRPVSRVRVRQVAAYYRDYVQQKKLIQNFRNNSCVTSIRRIEKVGKIYRGLVFLSEEKSWVVEGYDTNVKKNFKYICKNVVLASGTSDSHNVLNIPGELNYPQWVFHDLKHFENAVVELKRKQHARGLLDPVMIIGSGLSAADAVLLADRFNLSILHLFTSYIFLDESRFSKDMYPEYHQVYRMMRNITETCSYTPLQQYEILEFYQSDKGKRVKIRSPNGLESWYKVTFVALMVGYRPALNFLPLEFENGKTLGALKPNQDIDSQKNPIAISPYTYEVKNAPAGMYAMGPLVGDNVVRVIHGGAIAIANHLYKRKTH